jgi:hypothetical protein
LALGCNTAPEGMVLGKKGRLYFGALPAAALNTRLILGSEIAVKVEEPKSGGESGSSLTDATLRIEPEAFATITSGNVGAFTLQPSKAGVFSVVVDDAEGNALDEFAFSAATSRFVDVRERILDEFNVDGRVGVPTAMVKGASLSATLDVADQCGHPLLIASGVTVGSTDPLVLAVESETPSAFVLDALTEGEATLRVLLPDRRNLDLPIEVVGSGDVTELALQLVEGGEGSGLVWARAKATLAEVIGVVATWENADALQLLTEGDGPLAQVAVAAVDGGVPEAETPLTLTAKAYGQEASLDLRIEPQAGGVRLPAREIPTSGGCDDAGCDPFAAFFLLFLLPRRRLCDLLHGQRRSIPHG